MFSQLLRAEKSHVPLDHVFVDELWHDGDGHGGGGGAQNVLDLRILKGPRTAALRTTATDGSVRPGHVTGARGRGFADLQSDDVLPVDFADVVLGQQAVAGGGAVFDQRGDFPRLVDEAHVAGAVLVHGDGALERPADQSGDRTVIVVVQEFVFRSSLQVTDTKTDLGE